MPDPATASRDPKVVRVRLLPWAAALLCLGLTLAGVASLGRSGMFGWHLQHPQLLQAGLELGGLAIGLFVGLRLNSAAARTSVCLVLVALYLRHHAVDVALLASAFYCLGLYGLGAVVDRWFYRGDDPLTLRIGRRAAIGLALLSLGLWSVSLVRGLGFEGTRILGTAAALAGCVVWAAHKPWRAIRMPERPDAVTAALLALAAICILALLARSNVVLYYDSMWYGARGDRVLFGTRGVFNFLGLTTQVHYYPKLYEVALAPLQGRGDLSFDIAFNAWGMVLLMVAAYGVGRSAGLSPTRALALAVASACYPAFVGVAETTKGDIHAAAFTLFAIQALQQYGSCREGRLLADVLGFALLASALRLSTLPWLAVLCIATVAFWARDLVRTPRESVRWLGSAAGAWALLAIAVALLVHYRTWLLTGTPLVTNATTQALFDGLGWKIRYPVGTLTGGDPAAGWPGLLDVPRLAVAPASYVFHTFKWMGAIWLAGLCMVLVRVVTGGDRIGWLRRHAVLLAVAAAFPAVLCLNSWPVPGGDGNYFLVPAICLAVAGFATIPAGRAVEWMLSVCGVIGLSAYLVTSNWVPGTAKMPPSLTRSPFDAPAQLESYLFSGDLTYVARYFEKCFRTVRVTGLLPETGQAFALPVRYEPLHEMAWNNAASFSSPGAFRRLMHATGTQFIVLPVHPTMAHVKPRRDLFDFVNGVVTSLVSERRAMLVAERGTYRIYRLTESAEPRYCPAP